MEKTLDQSTVGPDLKKTLGLLDKMQNVVDENKPK